MEENNKKEELAKEFAELLKDNQDPKTYFKKKKYKDYFESYCSEKEQMFERIADYWKQLEESKEDETISLEQKELLHELAYSITDTARQDIGSLKGLKKGNRQGELNLYMVTSVFPCILELGKEYGNVLCEEIIREWKKAFPGTELGYADFEKLNSSFRSFWGFFTGR